MVHISLVPALTPLYLYVRTFRSMCAVPSMAVFCSSLTSFIIIIIIIIIILATSFGHKRPTSGQYLQKTKPKNSGAYTTKPHQHFYVFL